MAKEADFQQGFYLAGFDELFVNGGVEVLSEPLLSEPDASHSRVSGDLECTCLYQASAWRPMDCPLLDADAKPDWQAAWSAPSSESKSEFQGAAIPTWVKFSQILELSSDLVYGG